VDPDQLHHRRQADLPAHLLPADRLLRLLYVAITFNPVEVADDMKKYGGFIPASAR
jgi:hypothetical protein